MSEFAFLFRGSDRATKSPEQAQKTAEKWVAWMKALGERGHLKETGHPLDGTGKVVRGKQKAVTDGPYAEAKDIVSGHMLIEAKDVADAVELAKACPIFEDGGSVEVRPVLQLSL
jgi:hypothetical protein